MKNKSPSPDNTSTLQVSLVFHGSLQSLLSKKFTRTQLFKHSLQRRASIKDVIESLGVPHTEIETLQANNTEVSFAYIVQDGDHIEIFPQVPPVDIVKTTLLRLYSLEEIRFVVDTNVGKLASLLRMAGFDTFYKNGLDDAELAHISQNEKRILLTRDRKLLNRKNIVYGHLVRECKPEMQLKEIISFYGLKDQLKPFSRCMACNGLLEPVRKETIIHRLKPLTKKYYNTFQRCSQCDKLYWPGSHKDKMTTILKKALTIHNH
jgi:hypothetical protein